MNLRKPYQIIVRSQRDQGCLTTQLGLLHL